MQPLTSGKGTGGADGVGEGRGGGVRSHAECVQSHNRGVTSGRIDGNFDFLDRVVPRIMFLVRFPTGDRIGSDRTGPDRRNKTRERRGGEKK